MRRLLLAAACLGVIGAAAAPAVASQPVPVGVGKDSKGGECVYAFSWVPQCVDPVNVRSSGTSRSVPPCPPRQPGVQVADGDAYVSSGCLTVVVPLPGIDPPRSR